MRPGLLVAGVVVAAVTATSACGLGDAGPDVPVTAEPDPGPAPPEPVPAPGTEPGGVPPPGDEAVEEVTPTPGMVDVRPVPWDESTVDGSSVTVRWWSGVAPCTVLDRVEVEEDDDTVTVTLFEGSDPAEPDAACIELAVRKQTTVELAEPVGQRSLVDGAE